MDDLKISDFVAINSLENVPTSQMTVKLLGYVG